MGELHKATNGLEAYNYVLKNVTYDMIFLDLEMPIKNGYEACKMIINHYKAKEEKSKLAQVSRKEWLNDLNYVYNLCITEKDQANKDKLLTLFKQLYKTVKYYCLDTKSKPFIFAYTGFKSP